MNLQECIKYIKDFLNNNYPNKNLRQQLELFKTYNFAKIGIAEGVHEDSTILAKAIYFVLWHDNLPMLNSWSDMGKNYGGETTNTFNSLFQESLEGAKIYISEDDEDFYSKVCKFNDYYLTIGNFMLLPLGKSNGSTLNTRKGSYNFKYKDYADLFLFDLFETSHLDDLKKVNADYFNNLTKEEFFSKNFLMDYYENNHVKIIFNHDFDKVNEIYYPMYWWKKYKNPKEHSDEYKSFALDYINKASCIIKNRANIMMEALYSKIID